MRYFFLAVMVGTVASAALLPIKSSAITCNFTRDLQVGVNGEDTRCLQKFLNSNGFQIAKSGVGSPGKETSIFGELTKQAVKKWQASLGITPTGYFGPVSRQKIATITPASTPATNPNTASAITPLSQTEMKAKIASILTQIENLKSKRDEVIKNKVTKTEAKDALMVAESNINKTQTEVDNAYRRGDNVDKANDYLKEAEDTLEDARRFYNKDNYDAVMSSTYESEKLVDKALKEIESDTISIVDAKEAIDEAKKELDSAQTKINNAENNGDNVDKAQSKLNEAQSALDTAEDYYDKRDYANAESQAEKSKNFSDEAVDAIDNVSKSEARARIDQADDDIDEAADDIDYAKERGRNIGSAESILNNARAALTTARNYYNNKNYTEAASFANKAIKYTNDALDQF